MRALSRKNSNKKSLMRNLATSLVLYEQITTTQAKAKELKPVMEHLIAVAKKNDLASRRMLLGYLFDKNATKKVIEVLLPRYKDINSGFVKTYKLGNRLGDGAPTMMMRLVKGQQTEITKIEGTDAQENISKADDKEAGNKTASKAGTKTRKTSSSK